MKTHEQTLTLSRLPTHYRREIQQLRTRSGYWRTRYLPGSSLWWTLDSLTRSRELPISSLINRYVLAENTYQGAGHPVPMPKYYKLQRVISSHFGMTPSQWLTPGARENYTSQKSLIRGIFAKVAYNGSYSRKFVGQYLGVSTGVAYKLDCFVERRIQESPEIAETFKAIEKKYGESLRSILIPY